MRVLTCAALSLESWVYTPVRARNAVCFFCEFVCLSMWRGLAVGGIPPLPFKMSNQIPKCVYLTTVSVAEVLTSAIEEWINMEHRWNDTRRNQNTRIKPFPSSTLSTTNSTRIIVGSNPGLSGYRPATNGIRHGTASESTVSEENNTKIGQTVLPQWYISNNKQNWWFCYTVVHSV
jgi:hypothetical protein